MVSFLDLRAQYESIRDEIRAATDEVLEGVALILGPAVERVEEKFGARVEARPAIGVNSDPEGLQGAVLGIKMNHSEMLVGEVVEALRVVA